MGKVSAGQLGDKLQNISKVDLKQTLKDALQNSNFSVEVVKVSFVSSLESAKVSKF